MLKSLITTAGVGMMALTMTAGPADAHRSHYRHYHDGYGHAHYYNHSRHYRNCRTAGTVVGVIGGAVVGNAITHHSGLGTVAGAGIGGLAGHDIASRNCRRR